MSFPSPRAPVVFLSPVLREISLFRIALSASLPHFVVMGAELSIEDVHQADARIHTGIARTPFHHSRTLSKICGADLYVKFENLQFTASFKERGALNRLLLLTSAQRAKGVVAVSAGNHAQGVAYHASRLGIPATIVMPKQTPFVKVRHTQDFGAKVLLEGDTLAEAFVAAEPLIAQGATFIHPYDDPDVIAGQGTIALEIAADQPALDNVIIPIGGGGLITGMAVVLRALMPKARIIGVRSEYFPTFLALTPGEALPPARDTIAEGIAVKNPGSIALALAPRLIDEVLIVPESTIEQAVALFINVEKTVAEGAGAAALACVLKFPEKFRGQKTALVLSGGNIDTRILASVLMRGLVREGRIARLRIEISDSPGTLAQVAAVIGSCGGNIIEVSHQRTFAHVSVKNAWLDIAVETRDATHMRLILDQLGGAGFPVRMMEDIA